MTERWDRRVNLTTLSALAEPSRFRIVELLRDGPASVNEIAAALGLGQPQTSKHLRVLSEAGIVEVQPVSNRRIYSVRTEPLQRLGDWLEKFRSQQDERYGRLDIYLNRPDGDA